MYRTLLVLGCLLAVAAAPQSAPPSRDAAIYGHVDHLGWIVNDLDAITRAWRTFGVTDIHDDGVLELPLIDHGRPTVVRIRRATARIGTHAIHWIQPLGGTNALTAFLASHGEGIHHVAFSLPTPARFDQELRTLAAAGVGVAQEGTLNTPAGPARFAYLETAAAGGITVELLQNPASVSGQVPAASTNQEPFNRITQFAFVVRDIKAVNDYWTGVGLGGFTFSRNVSLDRVYRGQPGRFEMLLGFNRHGEVPFEWIQPLVGPSVYDEYVAAHHEGFHHLGFDVTDFDATVARLGQRGLHVTMSGGWNSNGSEGRFAYLDAERHGGVTIELLWNKPRQ